MFKKLEVWLGVLAIIFIVTACEYEKLEPLAEIPEDVSFKDDLMPMFNLSCNMSGCHPAGGIPPDLSPESGYFGIIYTGMVDTLNPESSILYERMIDTRRPMPPAGLLSEYEINLVLSWIKEGAKNN